MRRVVMLFVVLSLAGCAEDQSEEPDGAAEAQAASQIPAPEWQVGDWWTYQISSGDRITWVVTEDGGTDWVVDVDHEQWAFDHTAFNQVSTIGLVSKAHLEGSQEDGRVKFYDFPLTQNKTWQMRWDAMDWDVEVVDLFEQTAEIHATNMNGDLRVYIYDNETKWFDMMSAYDMNETFQFGLELADSGSDYRGNYVRWTIHGDYEYTTTPGQQRIDQMPVDESATDIWYWVSGRCDPDGLEGDQGAGVFEFHPEDDGNYGLSFTGACPIDFEEFGELDPHPPAWGLTALSGGVRYDARFIPRTLELLQVAA